MGALNVFPVSVKVAGRRIVIIGGGVEALAKARLVVKTSAEVLVVSQSVTADFATLDVTLLVRGFEVSDLENAALVFLAEQSADAESARAAARAAGILVNEVDVPEACDFYTPAIIDRAPISVAISSEGDAPVLARLVRAKIEATLSPNLGGLARLAGSLRDKVADALLQPVARRRFYEDLVSSKAVEAALDIGASDGLREALGLLDGHVHHGDAEGAVWLVGAGPGSEDLLTLRAQRLLQEADVIVHDQLVPDAVVQMGRRDAELINVGKAKGHHSFSQSRINGLLVRLAKQNQKVVRLKSGDPMVFGRAGEEIAALRKAGIAYHIVPGVTAALAAAADSATPVTLRNVSSGFVVATAHGAKDAELDHWVALAGAGITLGLYMGKSIAAETSQRLIAAGLNARTPVGIVVNAGRANRSLYHGVIGDLAAGEAAFADGPALILVGETVAHGDWTHAVDLADQEIKVA